MMRKRQNNPKGIYILQLPVKQLMKSLFVYFETQCLLPSPHPTKGRRICKTSDSVDAQASRSTS